MLSSVSALYHVPLPKNVVVRSARECSRPTAIASKLCSDSTGNKQVETSIGVRSNFSRGGGNVDTLLTIFKLLTMQCKWTFTERFILATPQRK